MYYYNCVRNYMEFWYRLMRSATGNLSNSDFYTKIRLFSDHFLAKSLNSDQSGRPDMPPNIDIRLKIHKIRLNSDSFLPKSQTKFRLA